MELGHWPLANASSRSLVIALIIFERVSGREFIDMNITNIVILPPQIEIPDALVISSRSSCFSFEAFLSRFMPCSHTDIFTKFLEC